MSDILPTESPRWQAIELELRRILEVFGYAEIRTPLLEETELFQRSVGTSTDIVEKEMFSFEDKGGTSLSLRPEGTASVVRSYVENHMDHGNPLLRLYYIGPMFRHERPQKGRLRQFHQVGAEAFGSEHPQIDVEIMSLVGSILGEFGVEGVRLELNSVGDEACRPAYKKSLSSYLSSRLTSLCENCQRRATTNPMRVFDCKSEGCRAILASAPLLADTLCVECKAHQTAVEEGLRHVGVPFHLNPRIVRGLDYYTRTAFEFSATGLGSQNAVAAGGRYDGLVKELGGPSTPGIGFAMGIERLLLASQRSAESHERKIVFLLPIDPAAEKEAARLASLLRSAVIDRKIAASIHLAPKSSSLKSALRQADKVGAVWAVIVGVDELKKSAVMLKNLKERSQEEISFSALEDFLIRRLV